MLMTCDPRGAENQRTQRMAQPTRGMVLEVALDAEKTRRKYVAVGDSRVREAHQREE